MMRHIPYARKRKQLKRLARKLTHLAIEADAISHSRILKLIHKIKQLVWELRGNISFVEIKRVVAAFVVVSGLSISYGQEFATPISDPFGIKTYPHPDAATLADLDGDGDLDLIAATSGNYSGTFLYYKNSGSAALPEFEAPQKNPFGLLPQELKGYPVLIDIDGDGDFDLMEGKHIGPFHYYENTGTATEPEFSSYQENPFGLNNIVRQSGPKFVDIDMDGDKDMFVVNTYEHYFEYFENIGSETNPQFTTAVKSPFGLPDDPGITRDIKSASFMDMDRDGDFDILCGMSERSFLFIENTGTPEIPLFFTQNNNSFGITSTNSSELTTFADFDADGDLDLLSSGSAFQYFENIAPAPLPSAFILPQKNPFGLFTPQYIFGSSFADLDGDGDFDMLASQSYSPPGYSPLLYYENIGTLTEPQFAYPEENPFGLEPVSFFIPFPALADLDADGDQDLLEGAIFALFSLHYFENIGTSETPSFDAPLSNPFGLTVSTVYRHAPAFADLDADGDLDLLVGDSYGIRYFENIGDESTPQFAEPIENPFGFERFSNTNEFAPTLTDLDKDGDIDLLLGFRDARGSVDPFSKGNFLYFENIGSPQNPQFASPTENPFGLVSTNLMAFPSFVDIDHDGDEDLFVGQVGGKIQYFENISPTTISAEASEQMIIIYPNPTEDLFTIETSIPIKKIEILNVLGESVKKYENGVRIISIGELSPGTYFIKVIASSGLPTIKKIIKN